MVFHFPLRFCGSTRAFHPTSGSCPGFFLRKAVVRLEPALFSGPHLNHEPNTERSHASGVSRVMNTKHQEVG